MNFIALLISFLSLHLQPANPNTTIDSETGIVFFQGTWAEVMAEAAKQNKLIFVDAYAVWCGPCKWMTANVFNQASVGEFYNKNFINYKFDMERGEGKTFARNFRITAYPTLVYTDAQGKEVFRSLGAKNSEQFISVGNSALSAAGR